MKIKSWDTDYHLYFDNNWYIESPFFKPDCDVYNYAHFNALKDTTYDDIDFNEKEIHLNNKHCEYGFHIQDKQNEIWIPCYSEQNGYYGSELCIRLYNDKNELVDELIAFSEEKYIENKYN